MNLKGIFVNRIMKVEEVEVCLASSLKGRPRGEIGESPKNYAENNIYRPQRFLMKQVFGKARRLWFLRLSLLSTKTTGKSKGVTVMNIVIQ